MPHWPRKGAHTQCMLSALLITPENESGAAQDSALAPWLTLLPAAISTPLHYSAAELEQLRGTTLHSAVRS